MNIQIIGSGFVGLTLGLALSNLKSTHHIHFVDPIYNDPQTLEKSKNQNFHFFEPGLKELAFKNQTKLTFSPKTSPDIDITFICLPTPTKISSANPNPNSTQSTSPSLTSQPSFLPCVIGYLPHLSPGSIVCIKSTTLPTTCQEIGRVIKNCNYNLSLCHWPEFLRVSHALEDTLNIKNFLLGLDNFHGTINSTPSSAPTPTITASSNEAVSLAPSYNRLFTLLCEMSTLPPSEPLFTLTSTDASEFAKYAINTSLANKLSCLQELRDIAHKNNIDFSASLQAIKNDTRLGTSYNDPNFSWGGACLPKDTLAFAKHYDSALFKQTIDSNAQSSNYWASVIVDHLTPHQPLPQQLCWLGVAFKENTNCLILSPSINLLSIVIDKYLATKPTSVLCISISEPVCGSDPCMLATSEIRKNLSHHPLSHLIHLSATESPSHSLAHSGVAVLACAHKEFSQILSPASLKKINPALILIKPT